MLPRDCSRFYHPKYYEALDLVVNMVKSRFDQDGYKMYVNLEQLLVKATNQEEYEEMKFVT